MPARVCYIGGVSAAGKSTAAAEIAAEHGIGLFRIDDFHNVLHDHGLRGPPLNGATQDVARQLVTDLLTLDTRCIVEGVWLTPEHAAVLRAAPGFRAVFCGYPNADPHQRLGRIWTNRPGGAVHWLQGVDRKRAIDYLAAWIDLSRQIEKECARLGIDFIDVSDLADGAARLKAHVARLFAEA